MSIVVYILFDYITIKYDDLCNMVDDCLLFSFLGEIIYEIAISCILK